MITAHARVAFKIYERLQDPWGALEARLLVAQVALGRDDPLASLGAQYADFALWQRGWLDQAALDRGLAYWK